MTKIQECLLGLLKEIDELCQENNIVYYIFAGSMLGIERNEGFLPWDDDIDIIMTQNNYQKFSELMRTKPLKNRRFECIEQNKEYPLQFGKYISTDNSCITRSLAFGNSSAGAWIDIIYVAPLPKSTYKINRIKKWFCCYCELENEVYVEHKNHYKGFYWRYRLGLLMISIFGKECVLNYMKRWFNGYSESDCDLYFMYHSLFTDFRAFEKKFFTKPIRRSFDGVMVNVSPFNREFCRILYGDSWMMIPDVSNRSTHKTVFDTEIPYYKYVDDYMVFLDKKKVANNFSKVKKLQMKNFEFIRKAISDKAAFIGPLVKDTLIHRIEIDNINLDLLVKEQNYDTIGELYEDYLKAQFDDEIMFWKAFIDLDDELLYPVLMKMICCDGKYYYADRIIQLRKNKKREAVSQDIKQVELLIDLCRRISIAIWDRQDFDLLEKILYDDYTLSLEYFCVDIELAYCYLEMKKASSLNDFIKIKDRVNNIFDIIPNQGEGIKILADIECVLNNYDEADGLYQKAKVLTRNGLLLLDINKKLECKDSICFIKE